ncbi:DEAD/DEAH box helicase [Anaeromyxobacter oryzisoli]|uniref:DEAD/DEAH box helicase n=1 Tax=Anaeromyxobacter oryzisoli TaxID=2925408 RepID=UPI001F56B8C4|nr:DEAD/DEAH box helicase [Anaeromyxobacter sp. SG63]
MLASAARLPTLVERLTPDVVYAAFREEALADGRDAVEHGRVSRPDLRLARADAVVVGGDRRVRRARLTWGGEGLSASCTCGEPWCGHAAALALLLIGDVQLAPGEDEEALASPRDAERRRRESRGASELFEIRRRPSGRHALLGEYQVASPSSRAYDVTLRALDDAHNGCTCPDYETNLLGTCKHIEAVLHRLRADAPRRVERALAEGPRASYLHLVFDPAESLGIRLAGAARPVERRLAARFFGTDGRLRGALEEAWPELERAAIEAGVEIPREVARLAERAVEAGHLQRRREAVEAEVRAAGAEQPGLRMKLYPYQVEGVAFLASRGRALLADEMGLGKTAQAIAAMVHLGRRGEVRRTLIVCPASLKHQWLRELLQFTGLGPDDVAVVAGPREARRASYVAAPPVLVTSYELARADERELAEVAPDLLVLDEAQRIKNWRTRTAAVVKGLGSRFAFVLTGTPLENRLDDLYSLMQVVDPHLFGPLWRFNEEFTRLDESGRPNGYRNLDRLRARIAPVVVRRRKEEVLAELPARLVSRLTVPMTRAQQEIHADAEERVGRLLAIQKRRPLSPIEEQRLMRAFQRMRMACDAAGLVDGETVGAPKLEELERLLEEICVAGGRKVVVFSEWERMQALAAEKCERLGIGHVRLHGGVPSGARGRLIDRFRDDPGCQVFLSTDAGGVGLNLQAASHVVNLDLPWNPAVLAQRIARVHRLGQREAVNVVLLVSEGSFEERLERTLDGKRALSAAAVGDDRETVELERSTMARRIATLLAGEFAASTGRPPAAAPPPDPVAAMRERLGDALQQVLRLPEGRLVGVVRGEAPAGAEAGTDGAVLLPARAVEALDPLGSSSPFAGAEVLYRAAPGGEATDAALASCRELVALAERKRAGAGALVAAGQPGEALRLFQDAMSLACRALDPRGDPGADPAALFAAVHAHLVPGGLLTEVEANALARAGEAARAFAATTTPPPGTIVAAIASDAGALVTRARVALARAPASRASRAVPEPARS